MRILHNFFLNRMKIKTMLGIQVFLMFLLTIRVMGQDVLSQQDLNPENLIGTWLKEYEYSKDTLTFTKHYPSEIPIGESIQILKNGELVFHFNGGCIYDQKVLNGTWTYHEFLNIFETSIPMSESTKFKVESVSEKRMILIKIHW